MGVMGSPESVASPACSCGGPAARLRAGRPRSQGVAPEVMFLGARASCPHRAEGPQSADKNDTPEPATPRARGAQCRRGRPWVPCRGRALEEPESVGVARLAIRRACGPLAGGTPALPGSGPVSDVPGSAGILPAPGRRPAKRREERHPRAGHPRPRRPMPSRPALGALPRTGTGEARERGCRPLAHVAGLRPACGRDARAPRGWPCERCSWERGPKARKVPRGATPPSHPPPRPRAMPSRPALGALPRTGTGEARVRGARLAMWRACGPLAGGTPALPGSGPGSDVPGSAGILPAPGRRPAKCREERHTRAGHPPRPRRPMPSRPALGALPRTGAGGARERGCRPLADTAGLWPACGRDARAPRGWPCERCSGSAGLWPAPGLRWKARCAPASRLYSI